MSVSTRGVIFGAGAPKILVPLTAVDADELVSQATAALAVAPDALEWRLDHLSDTSPEAVLAAGRALDAVRGSTPVLATFRTAAEGGGQAIDPDDYVALYRRLVAACIVDLVDVEIALPAEVVAAVIGLAHPAGVLVVASSHDFRATPPAEQIEARLVAMADAGADICKIAVMPTNVEDVLTLLGATRRAAQRIDRPLLPMSMGGLGVITRIAGELVGSAATFGMVGRASAPGQVEAGALRDVLALLHAAS